MIGELREIASTLEDYSMGFNSMALSDLASRIEKVADAMEAEEAAAAAYVAARAVVHEFVEGGPGRDADGKISPRPSCTCGAQMPPNIKTSPHGWFYGHKTRETGR